jgi:transposase-like protein
MGKKNKERRVYTREFKAAAPAEKKEKPISRIVVDLGVNESVLRRWMQQAQQAAQGADCRPFPDMDGPGTRNWPGCGKKTKCSGRRCEAPLHSKS